MFSPCWLLESAFLLGSSSLSSTGKAIAVDDAARAQQAQRELLQAWREFGAEKPMDFPAENGDNGDSTTKKGMTCKNCLVGASELLRSVQVSWHPTYHY